MVHDSSYIIANWVYYHYHYYYYIYFSITTITVLSVIFIYAVYDSIVFAATYVICYTYLRHVN